MTPWPIWTCCQLGAREHYAIPRALHISGRIAYLVTEARAVYPDFLGRVPALKRFAGRSPEDFPKHFVRAFTGKALWSHLIQQVRRPSGRKAIMDRNTWFGKNAAKQVLKLAKTIRSDQPAILFAYSYAALECLQTARQLGWKTVVGQIDAGIAEERLVAKQLEHNRHLAPCWNPAPTEYWGQWREELALADSIVVNSKWSASALVEAGIRKTKLVEIPLAYEPSTEALCFKRVVPKKFSRERPLRVLFLGQAILSKGIAAVLHAIDLLDNAPVEFSIVGPIGITVPQTYLGRNNVHWVGAIARGDVAAYYRDADIFLFPTLSDGFGLTQLEAFSWGLPIIASRNCGLVVEDEKNGILVPDVTGAEIARALQGLILDPARLADFASAVPRRKFGLGDVGRDLTNVESVLMSRSVQNHHQN